VVAGHEQEFQRRAHRQPVAELPDPLGGGEGPGMHEITQYDQTPDVMAVNDAAQTQEIARQRAAGRCQARFPEELVLAEMQVGDEGHAGARPGQCAVGIQQD
jgi:hypothetical protein